MPTISFDGLLIVAAAALAAPLVLGLFPRIRLPAIVLEIVLGIVIGPQVLGWVSIDTPIQVMSLLGLAFLLLLAGRPPASGSPSWDPQPGPVGVAAPRRAAGLRPAPP